MTFGSEQVFALIGSILQRGDEESYEPFCKIVYEDAGRLINRICPGIQVSDKDDLLQNVVWSVLRDLPNFYNRSSRYSEQQRNAYLKRVVHNKCMDFFRNAKKTVLTNTEAIDEMLKQSNEDDVGKQVENREAFFEALNGAFKINTTPDKLIAFVYNRLLGTLSGKSGSPRYIIERFDKMPLKKVYECMVSDLSQAINSKIPDKVLSPLKEKIFKRPSNSVFDMTAHKITDSGAWIINKVKEQNRNDQ